VYLIKIVLSVPDEGYYVPDGGYFERTWWRLFWAYLMEVILSVPDEGYFERTWWRLLRTWWRLFWAYLMKVIKYLMKVIPETYRVHLIWYLRFYSKSLLCRHSLIFSLQCQEELEDAKGVIRIRISKMNRQHNGQKIPKGQSESVYRRWTDNTTAKRY
jgi:hypothetical protein